MQKTEDDKFFVFTANAIPGSSLCNSMNPFDMGTYERFNSKELRGVDLAGVPMHIEHHMDTFSGAPLPHMGYVTGSVQAADGGVSVMIEIPPVPLKHRDGLEGKLRRSVVDLVKRGTFRDVSVQHWVDLEKVDRDTMDVSKKIVEISLTEQGALQGSHVTGHAFLDRSTLRGTTASGCASAKSSVVKSRLVFPRIDVPKHIKASISSMNERAKRIEAQIAMEIAQGNTTTRTAVEAHLLQQLEEKERLLQEKERALQEKEKQIPALIVKASKYDELARKQTAAISKQYADQMKRKDEEALRILEESGYQNDRDAMDLVAEIKSRLEASEKKPVESRLDFSDPSQVGLPVDEFIQMMRASEGLQYAYSFARAVSRRSGIPAAAISAAVSAAPPVVANPSVAAAAPQTSISSSSTTTTVIDTPPAAPVAAASSTSASLPDPTTRPVGQKIGLDPELFGDIGLGRINKRTKINYS